MPSLFLLPEDGARDALLFLVLEADVDFAADPDVVFRVEGCWASVDCGVLREAGAGDCLEVSLLDSGGGGGGAAPKLKANSAFFSSRGLYSY